MSKPLTIDRHRCEGQGEEEKYKDTAVVNYWWGLRELAAAFDAGQLETMNRTSPNAGQVKEFSYLQILHYTVFVKLAGAFYQLGLMQNSIDALASGDQDRRHYQVRMFQAQEAFHALHSDLYQAVCALTNQLFTLLKRQHHSLFTYRGRVISKGLTPSNLKTWLHNNNHPDEAVLRVMLDRSNSQLAVRHHITHYGYVPVLVDDSRTPYLFIQDPFDEGQIMTRFDLLEHAKKGGGLVSVLDASKVRANGLCEAVDASYKYVWTSNTFEGYMSNHGLKLKDAYQPYWERDSRAQ